MVGLKILRKETRKLIRECLKNGFEGVSFSGGKDSLLLLILAREIEPDLPGYFVNTGAEDPRILKFIRKIPNIKWVYPKYNIKQVIELYGYPIFNKEISQHVDNIRNGYAKPGDKLKPGYEFLLKAPFRISPLCCKVLKKEPLHHKKLMLGCKRSDSYLRAASMKKYGYITEKKAYPIARWTDHNVFKYLELNKIALPDVYLTQKSSGCIFCTFGIIGNPTRFKEFKEQQPRLWGYMMKHLGMEPVLRWLCANCDELTLEGCGLI